MTFAPGLRPFAASLWLALAIVFVHALAPTATPWQVRSGSAFNGFTRDVSLGPSRAAPPEKDKRSRERLESGSGQSGAEATIAVKLSPRLQTALASSTTFGRAATRTQPPASPATDRFEARAPPPLLG